MLEDIHLHRNTILLLWNANFYTRASCSWMFTRFTLGTSRRDITYIRSLNDVDSSVCSFPPTVKNGQWRKYIHWILAHACTGWSPGTFSSIDSTTNFSLQPIFSSHRKRGQQYFRFLESNTSRNTLAYILVIRLLRQINSMNQFTQRIQKRKISAALFLCSAGFINVKKISWFEIRVSVWQKVRIICEISSISRI